MAAVVTGIVVHVLFAALGLLPQGGKNVEELASFAVDYTYWLKLLALAVAAAPSSVTSSPRHAGRSCTDVTAENRSQEVTR